MKPAAVAVVSYGVSTTRFHPPAPSRMKLNRISACLAILLASLLAVLQVRWVAADEVQDQPVVEFNNEIRPLLQNKCFRCHGPDDEARESDLRLDARRAAIAQQESGSVAIFPGHADQSEIIERVTTTDEGLRMPPVEAGPALEPQEVALLRRWINQGAEFQRHWAFASPQPPTTPNTISPVAWGHNSIDAFVLARLKSLGLSPADEADRYTLIRRLSLDLTGLPPTIDQVDRFIHDRHVDAYERLVDRLLQSPAFGERWARVWLDLARYADSAGYAQDPPRVIWRYRDWVISALNDNMPFDQFTVEQLAGDLLPSPSEDQLLATAFHRNTMTNSEGGTDDEEFRSAAIVDRVNTTMQVWMGLTMGCAQCHTHKYDPITQREYFQVFAILNNTADADRGDEEPTIEELTSTQKRQQSILTTEIETIEQQLREELSQLAEFESDVADGPVRGRRVRVELLRKNSFLSLAEVQVFVGERNVATTGKASQISQAFDGPAGNAIDGNTSGDYSDSSTTHTAAEDHPWWQVELSEATHIDRIVIWNRTDGGTEQRLRNFRVIVYDDDGQAVWVRHFDNAPQPSVSARLPASADSWTEADLEQLSGYVQSNRPELGGLRTKLAELKKRQDAIQGVKTPILRELLGKSRRPTYVHVRGNFLSKGELVSPSVPAAFHRLAKASPPDRLDLAHWLTSADNPLTARVTVNRFWEHLFGVGIVETSEDFGTQGDPPSHPKLLDHLALSFMQHDWDTKSLLKEIVTSATYRQSSRSTRDKLRIDPKNRFLSRGPSFRISGEMIRDQALAIAGLLSRKMYGPSVRPPRPNLGLRSAFGGSTDWQTSPGEDKYRRGLYTRWRRTTPYPSLTTFDAPSREVCTIRRVRTNTPLQALVTLNDPVFVEAAQGLARRICAEGGETLESRLIYGFRCCLSRPPLRQELDRLTQLYHDLLEAYRQDQQAAERMAIDPLGPHNLAIDVSELAALTVISNVLLNLDELLVKI